MTRIRKKCPECGESSEMTGWRPEKGMEFRLRQFRCKWTHYFYKRLTLEEMQETGAIPEWVE